MEPARSDGNTQPSGANVLSEINKQNLAEYLWNSDPAQERKLQWRVFPQEKGRVEVRDAFEESRYLASLLEDIRLSEEIDYNTLLPAPQPFRRFRVKGDREDELLPFDFKGSTPSLGKIPTPHLQPQALQPSKFQQDEVRTPLIATNIAVIPLKRQFPESLQLEPFLSKESRLSGPTPNDPG